MNILKKKICITRITPPKYKLGKYSLNEYELRKLMFEVANKEKPSGILIKDCKGNKAIIQEDGTLSFNLFGLDINSISTLGLIRIKKEKCQQQ
jgi:hypothetical protein